MSGILNLIRVEHNAIIQVLRILDQQLVEFNNGDSTNLDLLNDSIDFLNSYFDSEYKSGERLLFQKLREKNTQLSDKINQIDKTYLELEICITQLTNTTSKIAMDAFIPRSWFNKQARTAISTFHQYIELKESVLLPVNENSLKQADWTEIKTLSYDDNSIDQYNPIESYRSSLYSNIVNIQASR